MKIIHHAKRNRRCHEALESLRPFPRHRNSITILFDPTFWEDNNECIMIQQIQRDQERSSKLDSPKWRRKSEFKVLSRWTFSSSQEMSDLWWRSEPAKGTGGEWREPRKSKNAGCSNHLHSMIRIVYLVDGACLSLELLEHNLSRTWFAWWETKVESDYLPLILNDIHHSLVRRLSSSWRLTKPMESHLALWMTFTCSKSLS